MSGAVTGTPWSGPAPAGRGKGPLVAIGLGLVAVLVVGAVGFAMLGDSTPGDGDASVSPSRPAVALPELTPGPSPSTAVRPIGLPGATGTPTSTATPSPTSAPSTTTSPILQTSPPATPAPTPKPLGFGTLSYSASACFEVDWKDAKGRQISGAEARYAITVKNRTGARTRNIWIGVQTTDQFTTDPLISSASWSKRPKTLADETTLIIAGPRLDTGSTRLKWRVFYQTPIDVHTRIWIAQGPNPTKGTMTIEEIEAASPYVWDFKTNVKVCY